MKTLNNRHYSCLSVLLLLMCLGEMAQATCAFKQFSREMTTNPYSQCSTVPTQNILGLITATQHCNLEHLFDLMEKMCPSEHYHRINQGCTGQTAIPDCTAINRQDSHSYCLRAYLKNYYAQVKWYCDYLSVPISSTDGSTQPGKPKPLPKIKDTRTKKSKASPPSNPLNIYY